ncbi:isochorismatase family protein [Synechococcus sp. PCC 7335]|uniref:cysteine hydrolase family protein n=1 Tax=Synechococcus sp. (strain ATCC 29403 / PCC 7335) TaxID=91464 RepID=UPI00017EB4EF|nr:isochorismatase family cysteine hydrolase [Synechococcus sp. PCC 7335]EDX84977.1 isochorismatase family protein [Synechococcus sp. PCC 7335]
MLPSHITIPARPYPIALSLEHTALLVIDMQNDFCTPGGWADLKGFDVRETQQPIRPLKALLAALRQTPITIIHTREGHRPDLSDCPPHKLDRSKRQKAEIGSEGMMGRLLTRGSKSHDFVDELQPLPDEIVLDKPGKGAFVATDLDLILRQRNIRQLVLTGVTTECCVHTTLRTANDLGYECLLLEDCCASLNPEFHRISVEMTQTIFGWVSVSTKLLQAIDF